MKKKARKLCRVLFVFLSVGLIPICQVSAVDVTKTDIETAIKKLHDYNQVQGRAALAAIETLVQQTYQQSELRIYLERQMVQVLKSKASWDTKQFICQQLWIIGTDESAPTLAGMLVDDQTVEMACYALRNHQSPLASKALIHALGKVQGRSLLSIINLIGDRREEGSVSALLGIVRGPNRGAAESAVAALGKIASEPAVTALGELRSLRKSPMRFVVSQSYLQSAQELAHRGQTGNALAVYQDLFGQEEVGWIRRGAMIGIMESGEAEAVPLVMAVLRGNDWKLKTAAIANSHLLKGETVTKQLIDEFKRSSSDVQVLLIEALAQREKEYVLPLLTESTTSRSSDVRVAAVRELGTHGAGSSVPVVVEVLSRGASKEETQAASASLRRMQGEEVETAIVRSMMQAESSVRPELIRIISDRKIPDATDALLTQAAHSDAEVAKAALKALGLLAGAKNQSDLIRILTKLPNESVRLEAELALLAVSRKIERPAQQVNPIIRSIENTRDVATKSSFLRVLGGLGTAQAFTRVQKALDSKNPQIQDTALRALVNWPDARAAEPLLRMFRSTNKESHRVLALRGFVRVLGPKGELSAKAVASRYKEILKHARRADEKKLILSSLATVRDAQALKLVLPLLEDEEVKQEAELAASQIVGNLPRSELSQKDIEAIIRRMKNSDRRKTLEQILQAINTFSLDGCSWLWLTSEENVNAQNALPVGTVYFRKTLILPDDAKIRQAKIVLTADDRFSLYLNGREIGQGQPWSQARVYTVTQQMKPGKNVLAVEAVNGSVSPAGFIANLHIIGRQGRDRFIVSDGSWKASTEAVGNWHENKYDDRSWKGASVIGIYGCKPWERTVIIPK